MLKKSLLLGSLSVLALSAASSVFASVQEQRPRPAPWQQGYRTDLYANIKGGLAYASHDINAAIDAKDPHCGTLHCSNWEGIGSIALGGEYVRSSLLLALELTGSYIDMKDYANKQIWRSFEFDADFRPGFLPTRSKNLEIYLRGGVAVNKETGWRLGVGAEYLFTRHVALALDYIYTWYNNKTDITPNVTGISRQTATLGLAYYF